jgi:hypothetical protein
MTDEHRPYAELHLAEALMALGLKHAAAVFFADLVVERGQQEAVPPAVEALRTLVKGAHDELLSDEFTFASFDVSSLPPPPSAAASGCGRRAVFGLVGSASGAAGARFWLTRGLSPMSYVASSPDSSGVPSVNSSSWSSSLPCDMCPQITAVGSFFVGA